MALTYGAYTACLHDRPLADALAVLKDAGLSGAEVNAGGFIPSPHCPVDALLASKDRTRMSGRYLLSVEVICHSSWTAGATAGALAGTWLAALVGERIELLGFVLTSLFVVLAIENWRNHPDIGVLCLGLVAGGLAMGGSAALLTALMILALGLVGLYAWRGRRRGDGSPAPTTGQGAD